MSLPHNLSKKNEMLKQLEFAPRKEDETRYKESIMLDDVITLAFYLKCPVMWINVQLYGTIQFSFLYLTVAHQKHLEQ